MTNAIEFHGVSKHYAGGHEALNDISFNLARGEMAFLTGHSGAGKSTLLKLIACIERPSRGQVWVTGTHVNRLGRWRIPRLRRRIGIIFQDYALLYDRTVFDNVALPLVIQGLEHARIVRRVRAALDTVSLLGKENLAPVTLSGGEQQRVSIARAIVARPPLLLADEPTGNLDPELSRDIMHLFQRFQQFGVSVLIATHDIELIRAMPYRLITLHQGRLAAGDEAA
jgi:cell division transport system ATP-binding protein